MSEKAITIAIVVIVCLVILAAISNSAIVIKSSVVYTWNDNNVINNVINNENLSIATTMAIEEYESHQRQRKINDSGSDRSQQDQHQEFQFGKSVRVLTTSTTATASMIHRKWLEVSKQQYNALIKMISSSTFNFRNSFGFSNENSIRRRYSNKRTTRRGNMAPRRINSGAYDYDDGIIANTTIPNDKIFHAFASAILVWIFFGVFAGLLRRSLPYDSNIAMAATVTLVLGLLKELLDLLNPNAPWCSNTNCSIVTTDTNVNGNDDNVDIDGNSDTSVFCITCIPNMYDIVANLYGISTAVLILLGILYVVVWKHQRILPPCPPTVMGSCDWNNDSYDLEDVGALDLCDDDVNVNFDNHTNNDTDNDIVKDDNNEITDDVVCNMRRNAVVDDGATKVDDDTNMNENMAVVFTDDGTTSDTGFVIDCNSTYSAKKRIS